MFNSVSNAVTSFLDSLKRQEGSTFIAGSALGNIPDFPYQEYSNRLSIYTELENWYSGKVLDEYIKVKNEKVSIYPVRVNPINGAVHKHAHYLFGEDNGDERSLVFPRVVFDKNDETSEERSHFLENLILSIWSENNGRAIQYENGVRCQIYGGCFFRIGWDYMSRLYPHFIKITNPHPKDVVCIPYANDMFRLKEAWIVTPITENDAILYGAKNLYQYNYLIEHLTEFAFDIFVNDARASWNAGNVDPATKEPVFMTNPFGFVPLVYIPHERVTGFYGESLIDNVKGITKELNLRIADFGDAVSVDSHKYVGVRNNAGTPQTIDLAPGIKGIVLQSVPNVVGPETPPDILPIDTNSASVPMLNLVEELYKNFRRDAYIPAVADGEDEGSQRSGLTLAIRMMLLTQHIQTERNFWIPALSLIDKMILKMLYIKQEEAEIDNGLTEEDLECRIKQNWSPILPRDREMIVQEATQRMSAKLGSPSQLLEMLGDENPQDTINEMIDFLARLQEVTPQGTSNVDGQIANNTSAIDSGSTE